MWFSSDLLTIYYVLLRFLTVFLHVAYREFIIVYRSWSAHCWTAEEHCTARGEVMWHHKSASD